MDAARAAREEIGDGMKKLLMITIVAGIFLSSCSTINTPISRKVIPNIGYSLVDDTVLFQFSIEQYRWVTNGTTGKWVDISAIPVREVTIAGDFNNWNPVNTRMIFDGTSFYLAMPMANFTKLKEYQFKYIINEEWWVEPPSNTVNAASTKLENNGSNFVLIIK